MADVPNSDPRAKRHKVLDDFFAEVKKGSLSVVVEVQGAKFKLETPTEDDEVWADSFIRPSTTLSFFSSRRAPRLACAIREVNGVALSDLFTYPADMDKDTVARFDKDAVAKKYWLYSQLMWFLADSVPPPVIAELYGKYDELLKRRDAALSLAATADANFSKTTPGGDSGPTSSPEKAS